MSQYDAAATPMYNAFSTTPSPAPYTFLPARVPMDQKNDWNTAGAAVVSRHAHARLDLSRLAEVDLLNAGVVAKIAYEQGDPAVEATLVPPTP